MSEPTLSLEPDHLADNYRLACTLARLHRPFSAGRIYLERLLSGGKRGQYLERIRTDCDLFRWRRDPAFAGWLARFE